MTGYRDGREVEYRVRDHLTSCGWDVLRARGSRGPADLIAVGPQVIAFVSCKRAGKCPPVERRRLIALADRLGTVGLPVVASKPPRKPVAYRLLTGPGPKDWITWEPAAEVAA